MPVEVFTIGHSTHPLDRFLELLAQHRIELLADVRRFPGSRRYPYFSRESLATALADVSIEYQWIEALGGRRPKQVESSPNLGLRNASFRNYADYMATPEFQSAAGEVLDAARRKRLALMCSEGLYWRCHRRLVSDYLVGRGATIWHIMPNGELRPHAVTDGARFVGGEVTYPAAD